MQRYVSPEEIAKLLSENKGEITSPEVKHFQFVVILADDTYPQKSPAIISAVMGTPVERRATVLSATHCWVYHFPKVTLRRHAGDLSTHYFERMATESESFMENVTQPLACLAVMGAGHTARCFQDSLES